MKKGLITAALFAMILGGGIALWFMTRTETPPKPASTGKAVTIAVAKGIPAMLPLIAREKHFFEKEGLNVRYMPYYASGKETFDAMLAGMADISGPATIPVVLNSFARRDYSIFLTYTTTYRGVKIIARKDRGITSAADLKGKTIGFVKGTISQMTLDSLIAYKKILVRETVLRDFHPSQLPDAIVSGSLDAIAIWEPLASMAMKKLGANGVEIPTGNVYRIALNLASTNAFIAENHDVLVKIIRAMDRAASFVKMNRDEAQKIIADVLELDIETVQAIWSDYTHRMTLDQELIITMEDEAAWAMESGLAPKKKMPNYLDYVYTGALEELKPENMTLIKAKP